MQLLITILSLFSITRATDTSGYSYHFSSSYPVKSFTESAFSEEMVLPIESEEVAAQFDPVKASSFSFDFSSGAYNEIKTTDTYSYSFEFTSSY